MKYLIASSLWEISCFESRSPPVLRTVPTRVRTAETAAVEKSSPRRGVERTPAGNSKTIRKHRFGMSVRFEQNGFVKNEISFALCVTKERVIRGLRYSHGQKWQNPGRGTFDWLFLALPLLGLFLSHRSEDFTADKAIVVSAILPLAQWLNSPGVSLSVPQLLTEGPGGFNQAFPS